MSNGLINRQYVGARYVPKIMGEWNKALQYEALSVVTYMGNSFTSKVPVPANVEINNTDYWINTGNYNVQVATLSNKFDLLNAYYTPELFGCIGNGVTNDTINFQKCIDACIQDNKGLICYAGKKYLVDGLNVKNCHYLNFNNSQLIASNVCKSIITINTNNNNIILENLICVDNNCEATITITYMNHYTLNNISLFNVNNKAINFIEGYENTLQNIYIETDKVNTAYGLITEKAHDNSFLNFIIKNLKYGMYFKYGTNWVNGFHMWCDNGIMFNNSIGITVGGVTYIDNSYFDTVHTCISMISENYHGAIFVNNMYFYFPYQYESGLTSAPMLFKLYGATTDSYLIKGLNNVDGRYTISNYTPIFSEINPLEYQGVRLDNIIGVDYNTQPFKNITRDYISTLNCHNVTIDGCDLYNGNYYSGIHEINISLTTTAEIPAWTTLVDNFKHLRFNNVTIVKNIELNTNSDKKIVFDVKNGNIKCDSALPINTNIKISGIVLV